MQIALGKKYISLDGINQDKIKEETICLCICYLFIFRLVCCLYSENKKTVFLSPHLKTVTFNVEPPLGEKILKLYYVDISITIVILERHLEIDFLE